MKTNKETKPTTLFGMLRQAGVPESADNQRRQSLSRQGFRCVSASPERWSDGKKEIIFRSKEWHALPA